mmetsp:Transcript_45100/g.125031  ORF Transcript_45100/g.125031 Transcript_45100/m.125031 type:complete len:259 (+) Transcript_45100:621-1397(+)
MHQSKKLPTTILAGVLSIAARTPSMHHSVPSNGASFGGLRKMLASSPPQFHVFVSRNRSHAVSMPVCIRQNRTTRSVSASVVMRRHAVFNTAANKGLGIDWSCIVCIICKKLVPMKWHTGAWSSGCLTKPSWRSTLMLFCMVSRGTMRGAMSLPSIALIPRSSERSNISKPSSGPNDGSLEIPPKYMKRTSALITLYLKRTSSVFVGGPVVNCWRNHSDWLAKTALCAGISRPCATIVTSVIIPFSNNTFNMLSWRRS